MDFTPEYSKYACEKYRYTFKQFRAAFLLVKSGKLPKSTYETTDVQQQDLNVYAKAFRARCEQ
ncbi:MAG: hypothetical protein ACOX4R_04365 [Lentihominibacter sp.]|jgi:hypothetical protein